MNHNARRLELKWGIFQRKRRDVIMQLDVAPSIDGLMAGGHISGARCNCQPRREWHPQGIPLYVHERRFNPKEDVMVNDPKYDPNKAEPAKKDDDKKKKPETEDEEEEEEVKVK